MKPNNFISPQTYSLLLNGRLEQDKSQDMTKAFQIKLCILRNLKMFFFQWHSICLRFWLQNYIFTELVALIQSSRVFFLLVMHLKKDEAKLYAVSS